MYFPDELWYLMKKFLIDYKKHHKNKLKNIISHFENNYGEIIEIRTKFSIFQIREVLQNTSIYTHINPNLEITSICYHKDTGNWWCGYGWSVGNSFKRIQKAWLKN